ncbi:hypothetical protein BT69DRAFT_389715 [Atractiella rhizophila]|nr:hypothetical protein BT69DRAFT_389715 [Atractiella rhizophila]
MEPTTCRICRSPSSPTEPLFRPCLCRGSIAYMHQACLQTWLQHSRKGSCELCHSPFLFKNVYRDDMPTQLPLWLVIKTLVKSSWRGVGLCARGVLVVFVWLGILPWITGCMWEGGWSMGETVGWSLTSPDSTTGEAKTNETTSSNSTAFFPLFISLLSHENAQDPVEALWPWVDKLMSDVFHGQIITCFVVLTFVAAFLLREWIIQNTPQPLENANIAAVPPPAPVPVVPMVPPPAPPPPVHTTDEATDLRRVKLDALEKRLMDLERSEVEAWNTMEKQMLAAKEEGEDPSGMQEVEEEKENSNPDWTELEERVDASTSTTQMSPREADATEIDSSLPQPSTSSTSTSTSPRLQLDFDSDSPLHWSATRAPWAANNSVANYPESSSIRSRNPFQIEEGDETPASMPNPQYLRPPKTHTPPPMDLPNPSPTTIPTTPPTVQEDENDLDFLDFGDSDGEGSAVDEEEEFGEEPVDERAGVEDEELLEDLDGIMEAIGFRSIIVLCQNLALMVLLVGLVLFATIILPHAMGRIVVSMKAKWIAAPVRAVAWIVETLFALVFGSKSTPQETDPSTSSSSFIAKIVQSSRSVLRMASEWSNRPNTDSSLLIHVQTFIASIHEISSAISTTYRGLPTGTTAFDRATCTIIGYAFVFCLVFLYLQYSRSTIPQNVEQVIKDSLKQQFTVMKVAFFILIELLVFPFVCGVLLRFATLPVFPAASVTGAWSHATAHPLTSLFSYWLAGTAFMFTFAVFVNMVRESVRGGVLWWVRDPSDTNFHPVREILERGSVEQIRRICASGALYATLIIVGVGFPFVFLKYGLGVIPLRWHLDRPLAPIPIDLLCTHLLLPITIRILKPRRHLKRLWLDCYRLACKQLRLSSFMFSLRSPDEEGSHVRMTWRAHLLLLKAPIDSAEDDLICQSRGVVFRRDGTMARAPNHDSVKVVKGRRMIVYLDENGEGQTEEDRRIMKEQDEEAIAKGDGREYYRVVYLPPHFKQRVALLIYLMWFMGSLTFAAIVAVPLVLGSNNIRFRGRGGSSRRLFILIGFPPHIFSRPSSDDKLSASYDVNEALFPLHCPACSYRFVGSSLTSSSQSSSALS